MLDSYRDLIDGLLETPSRMRERLGEPVPDDVPEETVAVLREMRAREAATLRRAQSVMRKENATLRAIEDEPEMAALHADVDVTDSPEALLSAFNHYRSEVVSLLVNLTLRDWERPVNHAVLGETVLSEEIEDHLTWDETLADRIPAVAPGAGTP
ncbi:MAG TPA: hypothetical protein VGR08_14705 [Thermomicrobiales bacterium]|nr:hypothetical protein [Thermomicrobiales bacterium]